MEPTRAHIRSIPIYMLFTRPFLARKHAWAEHVTHPQDMWAKPESMRGLSMRLTHPQDVWAKPGLASLVLQVILVQSLNFLGLFPKVVRTNEIARSVVIT